MNLNFLISDCQCQSASVGCYGLQHVQLGLLGLRDRDLVLLDKRFLPMQLVHLVLHGLQCHCVDTVARLDVCCR